MSDLNMEDMQRMDDILTDMNINKYVRITQAKKFLKHIIYDKETTIKRDDRDQPVQDVQGRE